MTSLDTAVAAHRYASHLIVAAPEALPHRIPRLADMAAEQLQIACRKLALLQAAA